VSKKAGDSTKDPHPAVGGLQGGLSMCEKKGGGFLHKGTRHRGDWSADRGTPDISGTVAVTRQF